MLTRSDIDDILKLIDGSDFLELKLEMGNLKLELRRPGAAVQMAAPPAVVKVPSPVPASAGGVAVQAPLLGIFWHAPRPGAGLFVRPGDTVSADSAIGIIEVMKLMNSVPAGLAVISSTTPEIGRAHV